MPKIGGRTQPCAEREADARLAQARKFLDLAELTARQGDGAENANVSASLAVLCGISASDAACCKALGRRSRGQDHHQAEELVAQVEPYGGQASNHLRRLLNLKDEAQYGFDAVGAGKLQAAIRQANALVEFAETVVRR